MLSYKYNQSKRALTSIYFAALFLWGATVLIGTPGATRAQTNDPKLGQQEYIFDQNIDQAWLYTKGSPDTRVAVHSLMGFTDSHEDLMGRTLTPWSEFFGPEYGYASEMAGIIGANSNNGTGIAGIDWNNTMKSYNILRQKQSGDDNPDATFTYGGQDYYFDTGKLDAMVNQAVQDNMDIHVYNFAVPNPNKNELLRKYGISNPDDYLKTNVIPTVDVADDPFYSVFTSMLTDMGNAMWNAIMGDGYTPPSDLVQFRQALAEGVNLDTYHPGVNIASAGEVSTSDELFDILMPASMENYVVAVAGADKDNDVYFKWENSKSAPYVDVASAATNITSISGEGYSAYNSEFNSLSASTGITAGVASLIKAEKPDLTHTDVEQILERTALDIDDPGVDHKSGHGLVNAEAAVHYAATRTFEHKLATNADVTITNDTKVSNTTIQLKDYLSFSNEPTAQVADGDLRIITGEVSFDQSYTHTPDVWMGMKSSGIDITNNDTGQQVNYYDKYNKHFEVTSVTKSGFTFELYYWDATFYNVIGRSIDSQNIPDVYSNLKVHYTVAATPDIEVSGDITGNTNWSGKVRLTDHTYVDSSSVLTVQPGTEIRLDPGVKFKIQPGSKIVAEGTESRSITFTRADPNNSWEVIVPRSSAGNSFKWCLFEGGEELVRIRSKNNSFEHCTFRNSGGRGISSGSNVDGSGNAGATISHCSIENSDEVGIVAYYADMDISYTTVENSAQAGIWVYGATLDPFHHNVVKDNGESSSRDGIEVNSGASLYMREGASMRGYNEIASNGEDQVRVTGDAVIGNLYTGEGMYNSLTGYFFGTGSNFLVHNNSGSTVYADKSWLGAADPSPYFDEMFDGGVVAKSPLASKPTDGQGAGDEVPSGASPDGQQELLASASGEGDSPSWPDIWEKAEAQFREASGTDERLDYMHRLYQIAGLAGESEFERRFNRMAATMASGVGDPDIADSSGVTEPHPKAAAKLGKTAAAYYLKSLIRAERYERAYDYLATIDPAVLNGYNKRDYLYQKVLLETYRGRYEEAWKSLGAYYSYQETNGHSLEEVRADNSILEEELAARTGRSKSEVESGHAADSTAQAAGDETMSVEAYPNPFNPTTTFTVQLQKERQVSLKVYNSLGREVATLHNGRLSAGEHRMRFNATGLASGLYIYRLDTGTEVYTNTITLLK